MLGKIPENLLSYLKNEPVTQNEHKYGMLMDVCSQLHCQALTGFIVPYIRVCVCVCAVSYTHLTLPTSGRV